MQHEQIVYFAASRVAEPVGVRSTNARICRRKKNEAAVRGLEVRREPNRPDRPVRRHDVNKGETLRNLPTSFDASALFKAP